jgi:hypothetical protein
VRGGEGSFAGGGSFVTARSLAGDGEGGPERDMVGVGLNTPDTDGSGRDACNHVRDVSKTSFCWMSARRCLNLAGTPEEDAARTGLNRVIPKVSQAHGACLSRPYYRWQGCGAGSKVAGTCSYLPSAIITAPFKAHICLCLIFIHIRRCCPGVPAFLWLDWLPV